VLQFRLFTHTHHRDGATSSKGFLLVIYAAVQTVLSHTRLRVGSTSSEGFLLVIYAAVQTVLSLTHTHTAGSARPRLRAFCWSSVLQFRLFTVVSEPSGELRSEPSTSASVQTTGQKAVASAVCQTGRHVRWPRSPSIAISMSAGLSVYPLAYLKDRVSKFCQIFCACCLWPFLQCFDAVGWAAGRASGM